MLFYCLCSSNKAPVCLERQIHMFTELRFCVLLCVWFFFCFSNLVVMRVYQAGGVSCSTKPDLDGSTVYFVVSRHNLAAYL